MTVVLMCGLCGVVGALGVVVVGLWLKLRDLALDIELLTKIRDDYARRAVGLWLELQSLKRRDDERRFLKWRDFVESATDLCSCEGASPLECCDVCTLYHDLRGRRLPVSPKSLAEEQEGRT